MLLELLADAPAGGGNFWQTIIMILVALLFFYFILWRPEQKRRKAIETKRSGMKKGDRVTAMGIIGTVHNVSDQTVILKMHDGAKLEFLKQAITEVHEEAVTEKPEKEEKVVAKKTATKTSTRRSPA